MGEFLSSHAGHALLGGAWGWFAIIAALVVFNTVLGEELLFRGYLLPRMAAPSAAATGSRTASSSPSITCTCRG